MNKYLKEFFMWILIVFPLAYLYIIWESLPQQIATHFDISGKPNDWTNKNNIPYLIAGMNIGIYLTMLILPYIDPKKRIMEMGSKYISFRLLLSMLMTSISGYMLYTAVEGSVNFRLLIGIIAVFFALLGNYMQTLRPNYFFGIRSPWTLENNETWRKTHKLGGKLWILGGTMGLILSVIVTDNSLLGILFAIIVTVFVLVPFIYSYLEFKKNTQK